MRLRILRLVALVALTLALTPAPAAAADIRSGQDITIGTTETILTTWGGSPT